MTPPVLQAIVAAIRERGPISFAEYMEMALYGPGGYYERPPVGVEGDFVTSPHIHDVFGHLLGAAMRELHKLLGSPDPFRISEVGAGDGTLARGLLTALSDMPLDYVAVERSLGARKTIAALDGLHLAVELEGEPAVILAHELLDNLPFRRFRLTDDGPREVRVGVEGDRLIEVLAAPGDDHVALSAGLEVGEEAIHPAGALAFVDQIGELLTHGYALVIDYGGVGSAGGGPHGYRDHRVVEDLLAEPGSTDITAGVDFSSIATRAEERGLTAFPSVTQRHALTSLGFDRWIREELERQAQMLNERDGKGAVRTWSGRSRATLLVDPAALGRHRWLLLATQGLPAPSWLA